jgi:RHS repeat-associated protein
VSSFSGEHYTGDPVNPIFTTYDRSSSTGLDYAINRQYDPQDRFIQVDPAAMAAASPANPRTLNPYAYAGNDPVNNTDPTGLDTALLPCKDYATPGFCVEESGSVTYVGAPVTVEGPPGNPPGSQMSKDFENFVYWVAFSSQPAQGATTAPSGSPTRGLGGLVGYVHSLRPDFGIGGSFGCTAEGGAGAALANRINGIGWRWTLYALSKRLFVGPN